MKGGSVPLLDAIHHVAIIGSDYERSRHFYVDVLGFRVVREHHRLEKDDWKIDLACGDAEIELFIKPGCPPRQSYPEAYGLRHLAFRVDDVPAVVAELEARGVACEPVRTDDFTGGRMTFFHDPDGLPLEIHE